MSASVDHDVSIRMFPRDEAWFREWARTGLRGGKGPPAVIFLPLLPDRSHFPDKTRAQAAATGKALAQLVPPSWACILLDDRHSQRRYIYLVRVKTSITLPEELLSRLDRVDKNRSALLQRAAEAYLARLERDRRDRQDLKIIDRNAARLNRDARDTLGYQQLP